MNELEDEDAKPVDDEVELVETEETVVEKPQPIPAEVGIEALKKQLDELKAQKAEAERRAAMAEQTVYEARTDQHETNVQLVENAITTMKREGDILLAAIKEAKAAGDHDRETDLTSELLDAKSKLSKLEEGYEVLKGKTLEKPKPVPPSDPVEDFVSRLHSTASKNWIRANPEMVMTEKSQAKLLAAHNLAVYNDIEPDTPEYFASLETTLGIRRPVQEVREEEVVSEAAKPVSRISEAPSVAPVTRAGSVNPTRVTLSAAEREIAEMMNMKPEEYAKHKVALQKSGRMTAH